MKSQKVTTWHELAGCPAVGVDVCKQHLDIMGLCGTIGYSRRISNTAQAIGAFIKALVGHHFKGTILCEATSHYHLNSFICY